MKALAWLVLALGLSSAVSAAALERTGGADVSFSAVGPGGMKIVGTTSDLQVTGDPSTIRISVPLANLSTGIALRDKHMREKYLEVDKYPSAVLEVPRGSLSLSQGRETSGSITGTMTLHGQSHPEEVHYTSSRDGDALKITGSVRVNMKDFGIEVPSYLGVTVKPEVDVTVHFGARGAP